MSLDFKCVRSNLPPRTIMRGPGFLNAVMIIERCAQDHTRCCAATAGALCTPSAMANSFVDEKCPSPTSPTLAARKHGTCAGLCGGCLHELLW